MAMHRVIAHILMITEGIKIEAKNRQLNIRTRYEGGVVGTATVQDQTGKLQ